MSGTYDQSSYDVAKTWIEDQPELKSATKASLEREIDELAQVIQNAVEEHLESRRSAGWKPGLSDTRRERRGW